MQCLNYQSLTNLFTYSPISSFSLQNKQIGNTFCKQNDYIIGDPTQRSCVISRLFLECFSNKRHQSIERRESIKRLNTTMLCQEPIDVN